MAKPHRNEKRPPRSASRCRPNGSGTKPPGSAGRTTPPTGRDKLDTIRWVYGEMVRKIAPGETVRILVNSAAEEKRARALSGARGRRPGRVEFIVHPTNRGWTRDSGPDLRPPRRGRRRETAIVHFHFNAWAKYPDWQKDRRVPETAAKLLGKRLFDARCGGRDVRAGRRRHRRQRPRHAADHRGMLSGSEGAGAQPGPWTAAEFEAALQGLPRRDQRPLAGRRRGRRRHARPRRRHLPFREPEHGGADSGEQPKDVNYRPLAENWERIRDFRLEDGSKPEVVALPMPAPLFFDGDRLPASYANFLHLERGGHRADVQRPERPRRAGDSGRVVQGPAVVGIHAVDLVLGFGTLHCLTQQQPAE